tara:strand:+ start:693 stop:914 length:222 start_codon:yes stop_codon:yes gene_type:complete
MQKLKHQDQKGVKIMSKHIGVKEDKMKLNTLNFFELMTDEDLVLVAEAGRLEDLCTALSLDLNSKSSVVGYEA